jgi:hypothetical protein
MYFKELIFKTDFNCFTSVFFQDEALFEDYTRRLYSQEKQRSIEKTRRSKRKKGVLKTSSK